MKLFSVRDFYFQKSSTLSSFWSNVCLLINASSSANIGQLRLLFHCEIVLLLKSSCYPIAIVLLFVKPRHLFWTCWKPCDSHRTQCDIRFPSVTQWWWVYNDIHCVLWLTWKRRLNEQPVKTAQNWNECPVTTSSFSTNVWRFQIDALNKYFHTLPSYDQSPGYLCKLNSPNLPKINYPKKKNRTL